MKIKIIGPAYPYRGGIAAFNERLAREFIDKGHEVEIETFTIQYPGFLFPGKTQYADWPAPGGLSIKRTISSVWPLNWISAGRRIAKENNDIVIFKYWLPFMGPCFGTISRLISRNRRTRIITILDNIIPHEKRPGDMLLTRYFVKPVDGFIAMSASVLKDLDTFTTTTPRLYSPHPVFDNFGAPMPREEAIERLGLDPAQKYILFFGLVREYKGLDLLLEALKQPVLSDTDFKLLVAGEFYTDKRPYLDMISRYGLEERVLIHDSFIPDSDVSGWFSACDLVVQPYKSATQSGVTQIGYHFGKPMVVTDVGGLSEIITDGKSGYVVAPRAADIAEAIADYFKRNRMEELTRGVMSEKERFSWAGMVKSISLLYDQSRGNANTK